MIKTFFCSVCILLASLTHSYAQDVYIFNGSNYRTNGYRYDRGYQPYYYFYYYPSPQEIHYYNLQIYMAERNMRMAMYAQQKIGQARRAEENRIKNQKMADYHRRHAQ